MKKPFLSVVISLFVFFGVAPGHVAESIADAAKQSQAAEQKPIPHPTEQEFAIFKKYGLTIQEEYNPALFYFPNFERQLYAARQMRMGSAGYPTEQEFFIFKKYGLVIQEIIHFDKTTLGGFRFRRAELALGKALEDIAANAPFLLLIYQDFGVLFLDWVIPIAEQLPSQAAAVVQLMAGIEEMYPEHKFIDHICPRTVIEDAIPFDQYKNWMERSIIALEAFTMNDATSETIRSYCLRQIKDKLATAKPWKPEE